MTDANSEGFPICDERITENERCVIKIIGIHWHATVSIEIRTAAHQSDLYYCIFTLHKHSKCKKKKKIKQRI